LPRAEHPGYLNEHIGAGLVDGKVPNLGEQDAAQLSTAKSFINLFALSLRGFSGGQGRSDLFGDVRLGNGQPTHQE
jgi:hypothetical protein